MADVKVQIQDLDVLGTPTIGYSTPVQKTVDVVAKRFDIGLLNSYDTGSGYVGCYVQRQRIGSWDMRSSVKNTLNLTNPSTIIAVEPGIIIDDSGKHYPWHSVYDRYFYELLNAAATGTVISSGNTQSSVPGTSDNASLAITSENGYGSRGKMIYSAYVDETGSATVFHQVGTIEVIRPLGGQFIITGDSIGYNSFPVVTPQYLDKNGVSIEFTRTSNALRVYTYDSDGSLSSNPFYFEIYLPETNDNHTHVVNNTHSHTFAATHLHAITSISGTGIFTAGYWGKNVQVGYEWTEGASQVLLTHNNLGAITARNTAFGTVSNYANSYIMNDYTGSGNRGFINIIRKFES